MAPTKKIAFYTYSDNNYGDDNKGSRYGKQSVFE